MPQTFPEGLDTVKIKMRRQLSKPPKHEIVLVCFYYILLKMKTVSNYLVGKFGHKKEGLEINYLQMAVEILK